MSIWRFFIDVGGTFTDVVALSPDGRLHTHKLLSSGAVRGRGVVSSDGKHVTDPSRIGDPPDFWLDYTFDALSNDHSTTLPNSISAFDPATGTLILTHPIGDKGISYSLRSDEEAPVVAIRYLMGLRLSDPIGPLEVRLGTTRATNALLERNGARTAFVTTKGFADVLKIGYQDRPDLFKLHIRKRDELAEISLEIDERVTAKGDVLRAPKRVEVEAKLEAARQDGIEALAICLLHSHVNPAHEDLIAKWAEPFGFGQVSVSSRVARLERIVPRGDTTLVDAYLGRTIWTYVDSLRRSMPDARIQLMTSSGGLIDADTAGGKDTILSGPAGGVLGCAQVSRAAGFERVIGFDMGGTSTDVVRIEPADRQPSRGQAADATRAKRFRVAAGRPRGEARKSDFEYQHETVKAGVRIVTPMLAVETVAAGGGSVCDFDGQKLVVGPHSAGAEPGPACYGRGGPLTVTDMNLYLGRLSADYFPFALDRRVVEEKLAVLSETIRVATGSLLSPAQLAEGFVQIANDHMAAAIRKISIAKGYNPADYTLTTFGGAGGQHACAIAEILGIKQILCSPFAGVLSALGIGTAPIKRLRQQSVHEPLSETSLRTLRRSASEIESELRGEISRQSGPADQNTTTTVTYDVCYAGQSTLLSVRDSTVAMMRSDFEDQHRRLYGYLHAGREMEIRVLRVEVAAPSRDLHLPRAETPFPSRERGRSEGKVIGTAAVSGTPNAMPLFLRRDLKPGLKIHGPAIIMEDTSTIVIDPRWIAAVLPGSEILLERLRGEENHAIANQQSPTEDSPSPIRLELFNNQFAAIAEQMGVTLRRTALSTNVKERLDFSCALFTATGDLVVNAPHIPVHLGGMSECVKCLMEDAKEFRPGDVYVTNDPFRGGSHLNDITVITPVFVRGNGVSSLYAGLPDFFVASRAHHAEIGGVRPGSMPPESTNLAQEGVLIRTFPWMRGGTARIEEFKHLLTGGPHPSRNAGDNLADVAAQVAANQTGAHSLLDMVSREGLDTVNTYMRYIQIAAENKMRGALRMLPEGVHRFEDLLDDGTAIRLSIALFDGRATFDFTGTDPVHPGNFNANRAIVTSAVMYCLRCLIDEDIPLNAGVLAPVEIILPPSFLNPPGDSEPQKCPAVAAGNVETSQRIVDTVFGALRLVAASQGTMNNLLMGNARFGYYETICGGAGAGPTFHGADAVHTNMTNTRLTDPETLESRYPVRLRRFQIRRGSGGVGRFHGGDGVIREFEFLEPLDVSLITQRRLTAPYGQSGGAPGLPGKNTLIRANPLSLEGEGRGEGGSPIDNWQSKFDNAEVLPPVASLSVHPGDRLIIETPGGGAWGRAVPSLK